MKNNLFKTIAKEVKDISLWELGFFKKTKVLYAAAAMIVIVPIFYTGVFICSIWDPYKNFHKLPVSIVTRDEGFQIGEKSYNIGKDLSANLIRQQKFAFIECKNDDEAKAGVRSGKIYFAIIVPSNFSRQALGGMDKGVITYYTSSGTNYVAMTTARATVKTIIEELSNKIEIERWTTVLNAVKKVKDAGIKLEDGSGKALEGAKELERGVSKAYQGAQQITDGQKKISEGAGSIDTAQLVSAGENLHSNTAKLASALEQHRLIDAIAGIPPDEMKLLANGATEYQKKIAELGSGIDNLYQGVSLLSQKTEELATGLEKIEEGSVSLVSGLDKINNSLMEFVQAIPDNRLKPENLAISVSSNQVDLVPALSNGAAFTPYFMALSLWVGTLMSTYIFKGTVFPNRFKEANIIAKLIGKWSTPLLLSTIAALTLGAFVAFILRVVPKDFFGFVITLLATAIVYSAFLVFLTGAFGQKGGLISLLFLVLQISSAGGTYPIHLEPPFYQAVSPFFPLTNVVYALRASLFKSYNGMWIFYILRMLPWLLVAFTLSVMASKRIEYVDDDKYKINI